MDCSATQGNAGLPQQMWPECIAWDRVGRLVIRLRTASYSASQASTERLSFKGAAHFGTLKVLEPAFQANCQRLQSIRHTASL